MEEKHINTSSTQWGSYASDHDGASPRCDNNPDAYACPVWPANSLPLQLNSGNTIILAFSVNPANALTISLTGCPSYPCVGAKASRGGCDEGITGRTPKRTEPSPHTHSSFVDTPHTTEGTSRSLSSTPTSWHQVTEKSTHPKC